MEYVIIEGEVTLVDDDGAPLSTISGANGSKLEVVTELSKVIVDDALQVREQNLDSEGYIKNSSHNMAYKDGDWSPFNLDSDGRLKVVVAAVPEPHDVCGDSHTGVLCDEQVPTNIVRYEQLLTTSGVLRYDLDYIDCGNFI